jgi:hypothetical protein
LLHWQIYLILAVFFTVNRGFTALITFEIAYIHCPSKQLY